MHTYINIYIYIDSRCFSCNLSRSSFNGHFYLSHHPLNNFILRHFLLCCHILSHPIFESPPSSESHSIEPLPFEWLLLEALSIGSSQLSHKTIIALVLFVSHQRKDKEHQGNPLGDQYTLPFCILTDCHSYWQNEIILINYHILWQTIIYDEKIDKCVWRLINASRLQMYTDCTIYKDCTMYADCTMCTLYRLQNIYRFHNKYKLYNSWDFPMDAFYKLNTQNIRTTFPVKITLISYTNNLPSIVNANSPFFPFFIRLPPKHSFTECKGQNWQWRIRRNSGCDRQRNQKRKRLALWTSPQCLPSPLQRFGQRLCWEKVK